MDIRSQHYHADLVTHLDPLSHISEAFKIARTNIEFSSIDRELHTIAITSTSQSEGKTATLGNLAIAYAQIGRRVLLLECDLRRPVVHKLFGLPNRRGLTNILLGGQAYQEFVQPTLTENLSVLSSGPIPPNPAEMLMSAAFGRLLDQLRQDYDMVLIDCPPIGAVTDAAIVATKVDGTIYLVRAGKVDRRQLQRAIALLRQVKAQILGYIINGVSADTDDYYYYYYQNTYAVEPAPSPRAARKAARQAARQNRQGPAASRPARARRLPQPQVRPPVLPDLGNNPDQPAARGVESEDD